MPNYNDGYEWARDYEDLCNAWGTECAYAVIGDAYTAYREDFDAPFPGFLPSVDHIQNTIELHARVIDQVLYIDSFEGHFTYWTTDGKAHHIDYEIHDLVSPVPDPYWTHGNCDVVVHLTEEMDSHENFQVYGSLSPDAYDLASHDVYLLPFYIWLEVDSYDLQEGHFEILPPDHVDVSLAA